MVGIPGMCDLYSSVTRKVLGELGYDDYHNILSSSRYSVSIGRKQKNRTLKLI